jgi:uncharacterized membrane protein
MKKSFTTGLIILLPIFLTFLIVNFLINFLTAPFLRLTETVLAPLYFLHQPFFFLDASTVVLIACKTLILLSLFGFVLLVGWLGHVFLMNYLFRIGSYLIYNLPVVNKIYKACQDVVDSLFSSSHSFSQVVLVPFPYADRLSLGLMIQNHEQMEVKNRAGCILTPVFVPSLPNPSTGFILLFKKERVIAIDMKVEEAMKCVVSCGVVLSDFSIIQPTS